jgi:uncharacterized membrane protein YgcG
MVYRRIKKVRTSLGKPSTPLSASQSDAPSTKRANDGKNTKTKSVRAPAVPAVENEKIRQWIVRLVFIVYWLLIFEGAMRKWMFASMQEYLFFIRDPFVLVIYILVAKYGLWPRKTPLFVFGFGLSILLLPFGLLQGAMNSIPLKIIIFGWRNYCWYIPLAFIIGEHFRGKDLARLVKHTLLISIPIAVICYQQFKSPADASINQSYGGSSAMLVAYGVVRTSGTFTVAAAQTLYVGSVIAMVLAVWLMPKRQRPLHPIALYVCSASTFTTFAVAGTRSVFFMAGMCLISAIIAALLMHGGKPKVQALMVPLVLPIIGGIAYVTLFKDAFEAMSARQRDAQIHEGNTLMRALGMFAPIFKVLPSMSIFGAGLGMGSNGAARMMTGTIQFLLSEDDWSRIALEAGFLGLVYVGYRIWLVGDLVVNAIFATKRSCNPLPVILIGYAGINILLGQITMQGTINGYGWLFAGFCLAANRLGRRANREPGDIWA